MNRRELFARSAGAAMAATFGGSLARKASAGEPSAAGGPLRVHPENPRYFTDGSGKAVYLTGSHMWNNLVDIGSADPPPALDFGEYLDFLTRYHHNFIRLWTWEPVTWNTTANREKAIHTCSPQPYARTGAGKALDGKPKFNLDEFDPAYFKRLRSRVAAAGSRGIYVSIMLFEGWAMQFSKGAWEGHPFHPANNAGGLDGDANGDGSGLEVHTLASKAVTAVQDAYVRKVVDTVNDLDNVLYEISNENHPASTEWQYHVIDLVHDYEKTKPMQHPVGMTFQYKAGSNRTLFESPADWISPNHEGGYRDNPPAADGRKVILTDTDHLWGIGGNRAWVWKSFLRGLNPLFMDPYDGTVLGERFDAKWEPIRTSLGHARRLAERVDLAAMTPTGGAASSGYCLASEGKTAEHLVYVPGGGRVTVDLSAARGRRRVRWLDPRDGSIRSAGATEAGSRRPFTPPFEGDAVLWLARV